MTGYLRKKATGLKRRLRRFRIRFGPWLLNLLNQHSYRRVSEEELRAERKGETAFIFGSGYSINDISPAEWEHFEQHDTISFNTFVYQDKVRIDYHLIREIGGATSDPATLMLEINEYAGLLHSNPRYAGSLMLVQGGWTAIGGNTLVGRKLLPQRNRLFRFRNRRRGRLSLPSRSFSEGLEHGPSALVDCLNFAYILGWRRMILVGVDLYDRRYFWLGYDETREEDRDRAASHSDRHNPANAVVPFVGRWREFFATEGIELSVYNPRSLLAEVLPVYKCPDVPDPVARGEAL